MAKAFLITPFNPERAGHEDPEVFRDVQRAVANAAKAAGVELVHPAEMSAAGVIMDQVRDGIAEADIVLAILTGQNPNVFYELGIALERASRPPLLIVSSRDDVSFDLGYNRYWTYGGEGELQHLAEALEAGIRETLACPPVKTKNIAGAVATIRIKKTGISVYKGDALNAKEPDLMLLDLPEKLDAFKLLSWRVRLTKHFGYDEEFSSLISWATSGKQEASIRLLSGLGGSGKSRLAAELALELRKKQFSAGFLDLDGPDLIRVRKNGLVGIVDYPEQQVNRVLAVIKSLKSLDWNDAPIRLLLLSRHPLDFWRSKFDSIQAHYIVDSRDTVLKSLTIEQTLEVYREAVENLATHYLGGIVEHSENLIRSWLNREPELNCRPLFSLAAALHSVAEPGKALQLSGRQILKELARRERIRLEPQGKDLGFDRHTMSRLMALGALRGDLDLSTLRRLSRPDLELHLPTPDRMRKSISEIPQWDERHSLLRAPQPDLLAAALLEQVLEEAPTNLRSKWVWGAMVDILPNAVERLERIAQDICLLQETKETALSACLVEMSVNRYEALKTIPKFYDSYFSEMVGLQAFSELARIASEFILRLSPTKHFELAEKFSKQAELYELEHRIALNIYLAAWPISLLRMQISRGENTYFALKTLAGIQRLSGEVQHAAATATSTISVLEQSEALLEIPERNLEFERRDAYLFAAGCLADIGEAKEALSLICKAFSDVRRLVRNFASEDGLLILRTMLFRLLLALHRSQSTRANCEEAWKSDPQVIESLRNIMRSFNQVTSLAHRENRSTSANMVAVNLILSIQSLLGSGFGLEPGRESVIRAYNLQSSEGAPFLTKEQPRFLALALADLWTILNGRANKQLPVLVELLEFLQSVLSRTNQEKLSEVLAEVSSDLACLSDPKEALIHVTKLRAQLRLPETLLREKGANLAGLITFVLFNLEFDVKSSTTSAS